MLVSMADAIKVCAHSKLYSDHNLASQWHACHEVRSILMHSCTVISTSRFSTCSVELPFASCLYALSIGVMTEMLPWRYRAHSHSIALCEIPPMIWSSNFSNFSSELFCLRTHKRHQLIDSESACNTIFLDMLVLDSIVRMTRPGQPHRISWTRKIISDAFHGSQYPGGVTKLHEKCAKAIMQHRRHCDNIAPVGFNARVCAGCQGYERREQTRTLRRRIQE